MTVPSLRIQVLSDHNSWIRQFLAPLLAEFERLGHIARIDGTHEDLPPADICFCLSYSRIVSAEIRSRFRHCLVVHESALPEGRGWAPMAWQILGGRNEIVVSLIEAVDAVDAGPIYAQTVIHLNGTELCSEWRRLQAEATTQLCADWIRQYPGIVEHARPQAGDATVYRRRRPADSELDPSRTIADQFDLLRIVDNDRYPAFFTHRGRRYRLTITPYDE